MPNRQNRGTDSLQGTDPVQTAVAVDQEVLAGFALPGQPYLDNPTGLDINVLPLFEDYDGTGVTVAVMDESIDAAHPDLASAYDDSLDADFVFNDSDATQSASDTHATRVAGLIAAADDGEGMRGVAPGVSLAGLQILSTSPPRGYSSYAAVEGALIAAKDFDVVNGSFGFSPFVDSFTFFAPQLGSALEAAVTEGRDGLGTVVVMAAGNKPFGNDTSATDLQGSRHTVTVGATNADGKAASFTVPGSSVLISAPGVAVTTTDVGGGYVQASGTSFSAPLVSGVVALMLEANPDLGYLAVQRILAITARNTDPVNGGFLDNGATNVNGGGLHFSHELGFGFVDATAAVRLAETWTGEHTAATEAVVEANDLSGFTIPRNGGKTASREVSFVVTQELRVQHIEIDVTMVHDDFRDLDIFLVSPNGGVESQIFDWTGGDRLYNGSPLTFRLETVAHLFESTLGIWTLRFEDRNRTNAFESRVTDIDVRFYGDAATEADPNHLLNDTYFFTDEFAVLAIDPARKAIDDQEGVDTLQAAAVSAAIIVDLEAGLADIAGAEVTFTAGTEIENAIGGDGDDTITGNAFANELNGARGADNLSGLGGDDRLLGGAGNDLIDGGEGTDTAVFRGIADDYDIFQNLDGDLVVDHVVIDGLTAGYIDGQDLLRNVELLEFKDGTREVTEFLPAPDALDVGGPEVIAAVSQLNGSAAEALTIDFGADLGFENPLVFGFLQTWNGDAPAIVSFESVTSDSASFRVETPAYAGDPSEDVAVNILAVEEGVWRSADGQLIEAGRVTTDPSGAFVEVSFEADFETAPVVFAQIQDDAGDTEWAYARTHQVSADGFRVKVQEAEASDGDHAPSIVGWVAFEASDAAWEGTAASVFGLDDAVDHEAYDLSFEQSFDDTPLLLTFLTGNRGGNPAVARATDVDSAGATLSLQEEQSRDDEVWHYREDVSVLALAEEAILTGQDVLIA